MHPLDWAVIGICGAVVLVVGTISARRQTDTENYFRGNRTLPWWAIGISLIATAFSAASLLGGPGQGYQHGFLWLQMQIGDLVGIVLVCLVFIPVFVTLNLTTAYEYLEMRFDARTRSLGALCFQMFVLARLGGLLYGAALVVSAVTGLSVEAAIVVVGLISIAYTAAGGIEAVVWTDVIQFAMILVGVGAVIWVIGDRTVGGLGVCIERAKDLGGVRFIDMRWDPKSLGTFPTAVLAYGTIAFAVAGTNQQSVQRYVSCRSVGDARRAALLGWAAGFVGVAGALFIGVLLRSFYAGSPSLPHPDKIFPMFIAEELPPGLAGFLVAAIFAAAMSSIDSALHALSTSMVVDFYRRFWRRDRDEAHYLAVARRLIVLWGLVGITAALYVAETGRELLPFLVTFTTLFLGPVLGLFLLGRFVPRANGPGGFWGALLATTVLFGLSVGIDLRPLGLDLAFKTELPGIWFSAVTVPATVLLGTVLSLGMRDLQD